MSNRSVEKKLINLSQNIVIYDHDSSYKEKNMFGFLKSDPAKKLRKIYDQKSTDAMLAQRKGDIKTYSMLTAEAEKLWTEIEQLKADKK
jgi:hypothetical protein